MKGYCLPHDRGGQQAGTSFPRIEIRGSLCPRRSPTGRFRVVRLQPSAAITHRNSQIRGKLSMFRSLYGQNIRPASKSASRKFKTRSKALARLRNRRAMFETLEGRALLATLYVDNTPVIAGPGSDQF